MSGESRMQRDTLERCRRRGPTGSGRGSDRAAVTARAVVAVLTLRSQG